MVTKHASENSKRYLNPEHTSKAKARRFVAAVNHAMVDNRNSTAVVLELDKAVRNDYRDDWQANDRLVGIVRHGDLVTVMLSRKNQINKAHLRTDRVAYA